MFEWKVEDLALMNQKSSSFTLYPDEIFYTCEANTSREDKIAFIDEIYSGSMSYIIKLIEKFKKDKHYLTKNKFGEITFNAMRKWIKDNDVNSRINFMINGDFFIGSFRGNINTIITKDRSSTLEYFISEVFHQTLKDLELEEIKYFKSTDGYHDLTSSLREMIRRYNTTFGIDLVDDGEEFYIYDKNIKEKRILTPEEIDNILKTFDMIQKYIDSISRQNRLLRGESI